MPEHGLLLDLRQGDLRTLRGDSRTLRDVQAETLCNSCCCVTSPTATRIGLSAAGSCPG